MTEEENDELRAEIEFRAEIERLRTRYDSATDQAVRYGAEIERLHKIELQFNALKEERVRWFDDNTKLTEDNDRLRAALQIIADTDGRFLEGDDTVNAQARRALEPKP